MKRQGKHDGERKLMGAHLSVLADFMIVSFPEDAAFTICCSTDLLILALSAYITIQSGCTAIRMARQVGIKRMGKKAGGVEGKRLLAWCMDACLMAAAFLGATVRRPFFVLAAALWARRALLVGFACRLLVVPWTIDFVALCARLSRAKR
jgi:hypothetical protein